MQADTAVPLARFAARLPCSLLAAAAMSGFLVTLPVAAAEATGGTLISADGVAHGSVPNDLLTVHLALERDGTDPGKLNDDIQREAARALVKAEDVGGVTVGTAGYGVYQVVEKGRVVRHRGSYRLRLETREFAAGLALAGALQPFQVRSLAFSLSPARQREAERALIERAVADLREKLGVAARATGAADWRITQLSIGGGPTLPVRAMHLEAMAVAGDRGTAVEAEPGETQVAISVSGTALAH